MNGCRRCHAELGIKWEALDTVPTISHLLFQFPSFGRLRRSFYDVPNNPRVSSLQNPSGCYAKWSRSRRTQKYTYFSAPHLNCIEVFNGTRGLMLDKSSKC